jgi:hypothetical protein
MLSLHSQFSGISRAGLANGAPNLDYNKNIGFPLLKFYLPINTLMK